MESGAQKCLDKWLRNEVAKEGTRRVQAPRASVTLLCLSTGVLHPARRFRAVVCNCPEWPGLVISDAPSYLQPPLQPQGIKHPSPLRGKDTNTQPDRAEEGEREGWTRDAFPGTQQEPGLFLVSGSDRTPRQEKHSQSLGFTLKTSPQSSIGEPVGMEALG